MRIRNLDTNDLVTVTLIDPRTGQDVAHDFIANNDVDCALLWDEASYEYAMLSSDLDWWCKVISDQQAADRRVWRLKTAHDADEVDRVVSQVPNCDLEDRPAAIMAALDDAFGAAGSSGAP